jgi:hypothetical protein
VRLVRASGIGRGRDRSVRRSGRQCWPRQASSAPQRFVRRRPVRLRQSWVSGRGTGSGEPCGPQESAPILGDRCAGPSAVRLGRRIPWRWRRCASPSRTARRSRHGPHAGAGIRRTSPRSCPPRRRRARMVARGLGRRQRSCSESRTWRRSWRNGLTPPQSGGIAVRRSRRCHGRQWPTRDRQIDATPGTVTGRQLSHGMSAFRPAHESSRRQRFLGRSCHRVAPRRVVSGPTPPRRRSPFAGGGGSAVPHGAHPGTGSHRLRSELRPSRGSTATRSRAHSGYSPVTTIRTTGRPRKATAPPTSRPHVGRRSIPARGPRRHPTRADSAQMAIWDSEGGRLAR